MKKILWAIHPYEEMASILKAEASAIRFLASKSDLVTTEPVFVVTPGVLPSDVFRESLPRLRNDAATKMSQLLMSLSWPTLEKPVILESGSDHIESVVRVFLEHAEKAHADLIVLGTHSRRGITKLILGSFAETLLLHSPVPLLFVNPNYSKSWSSRKPATILFPTEFEDDIEEYFEKVVHLAKKHGSRIDVIHVLPSHSRSGISSHLWKKQQPLLEDRAKEMEKQFRQTAMRHGVEIKFNLIQSDGSVTDEILSATKRLRPLMIAMRAKSGELKTLFAGSITRQIVRASPCPVWAMHRSPTRLTG